MDITEICQRCLSGPIIKEKDFDLKLIFPKINEIIKSYEIKWDTNNPIPDDDVLADRIFEAAVDFIFEVGAYCKDTKQVIRFNRNEIFEALKGPLIECRAGEDKDSKVWKTRKPDQSDPPPWCHVGSGILSTSEELAMKVIEGYAGIKRSDSVAIPSLSKYKGFNILAGHPLEIKGSIQTAKLAREALTRAGRPGLAIFNNMPTSASVQATIASSNSIFGIRPSDGWLIPVYTEFKFNFDSLSKAAFLQEIGANCAVESSALLGGFVGGPEGVAIASVAYVILALLVFQTNYHLNFPVNLMDSISTNRKMLWALSVSSQAVSRNIKIPFFNLGYMANGPATENYFYEAAAYILCSIPSGVTCQTPFPSKAVKADGITPLEALFHTEMADAASKITRNQSNEIVNRLLEKYEGSLTHPDGGLSYLQCFDLKANKPKDKYMKLYEKIKTELYGLGVNFK